MQSTTPRNWRHALHNVEDVLSDAWNQTKAKARHLWPWSSKRTENGEASLSTQKRYGLERLIWRGGPRLMVSENDDEVAILAEMPGLDKKDFSIEVNGRFLVLRGKRRTSNEKKRKGYYFREESFGSFSRTIALPCEVDESKVKAKYRKGRLKIALPKLKESRGRVIDIDS